MRTFALVYTGLCLLLACACGPDFGDLETEVSQVCVRGLAMPFAGATDGSAESQLDIAELELDVDDLFGATVTVESVDLAAGVGIDDFSFADRIHMDLRSTRSTQSARLVDIDPVGAANPVRAAGNPTADLSPFLQDSAASLEITVLGDVPATPWVATVDVCLAAER